MEPPPDGGGNRHNGELPKMPFGHLQWSRRRMAAETIRHHLLSRTHRPFNGAAAGWRRKQTFPDATNKRIARLQWSLRRMAAETQRYQSEFHSGIYLQWSRRRMAAETSSASVAEPSCALPSMEPPPDGGGNVSGKELAQGLAFPSMEPPPDGGGNVRRNVLGKIHQKVLQWSRRRMAAETIEVDDSKGDEEGPSMEPPPDGGGNPDHPLSNSSRRTPFNGAAAGWRRKPAA